MNSNKKTVKICSLIITILFLAGLGSGSSQAVQNQAAAEYSDDVYADLVVGVPGENIAVLSTQFDDAGIINVIYGSPAGLASPGSQIWDQRMEYSEDGVESGDQFGSALASGDFNGDGRYDVAVGVPMEDIRTETGIQNSAGAVHIIYGSPSGGLSAAGYQFWHQDSPNVEGRVESSDKFGYSLAVGNFNGDDYDDLAVGVPAEDIDISATETVQDAGAVNVLYGASSGLSVNRMAILYQNGITISDQPEYKDLFGEVLAAVDFSGTGLDSLVVGVPHEDIGEPPVSNAGAMHVITRTSYGFRSDDSHFFHQGIDAIPDELEVEDNFASALAAGDFNGDGQEDLAIGTRYDDCKDSNDGSVVVIYDNTWLDDGGLNPQHWCQDGNIGEQGEQHDNFGAALTSLPGTGALPYRGYLPVIMQDD